MLAIIRQEAVEAKGGKWSADEDTAFKAPIRAQYEKQGSAYYATARLWDDGVIDPADTRAVLGQALMVGHERAGAGADEVRDFPDVAMSTSSRRFTAR